MSSRMSSIARASLQSPSNVLIVSTVGHIPLPNSSFPLETLTWYVDGPSSVYGISITNYERTPGWLPDEYGRRCCTGCVVLALVASQY